MKRLTGLVIIGVLTGVGFGFIEVYTADNPLDLARGAIALAAWLYVLLAFPYDDKR